jgi:ATP-dependent RNA helicase DeaD
MDVFRELVAAYEEAHYVPATDIAAAIAVLAQDGEPLLMESLPEPAERPQRARGERTPGGKPLSTYRISVGHRHKIGPRQIVGALANEGGFTREDFGRIEIRSTFSLVELPPHLSAEKLRALAKTRISGVLIELQPDSGRPADVRAKSKYQAKNKKEAGRPQASGNPRKPRHQKSGR